MDEGYFKEESLILRKIIRLGMLSSSLLMTYLLPSLMVTTYLPQRVWLKRLL